MVGWEPRLRKELELNGKELCKVQIWGFQRKDNWDAQIVLFYIKQRCDGLCFVLFFKESNFGHVKGDQWQPGDPLATMGLFPGPVQASSLVREAWLLQLSLVPWSTSVNSYLQDYIIS